MNVTNPCLLKNATISHNSLKSESLRPATTFNFDKKKERVEITFAGGEIGPGQVKLGLRWEAELDSSMQGYYASSYPTNPAKGGEKGQSSYYGLTQFEPVAARRAFVSHSNRIINHKNKIDSEALTILFYLNFFSLVSMNLHSKLLMLLLLFLELVLLHFQT